ncbi:MAG: exo-beta-N-acetylmuramidase NamZ domain-containing protein, partial [Acidobacteriota bacterium]
MAIATGLDRLLDETGVNRNLKGKRVGLVCNPASVDSRIRHAVDRFSHSSDCTLAAIFGPQHGFRSDLQDNMIESPHTEDRSRRVPIYSLYSETREPTREMLDGINALVVDLQDVGTRIYTFVYTMANCLRAAARHGQHVIVCDRPNPIGGVAMEGALLQPDYTSFVGQFPIPMRHGMTIGELARLFNEEYGIGASLEVIPMRGWTRPQYFNDTGLPWVMPSPNIPTLDSAIVYPGTVLFEGTLVSEGRGTTRPFEIIGAPWIDGERFAQAMNARSLAGVYFRPAFFEPTFQKHAQQTCGGCQLHVLDREAFLPVKTAVAMIVEFRREDPARFAWKEPPYEYEYEKTPIDIMWGSDRLRKAIEAGVPADEIAESWTGEVATFEELRGPSLLYR